MPFTYSLEHEDNSPAEPATVLDKCRTGARATPSRSEAAGRYTWSRSGRVRSRTTIPSWSLKLPNPLRRRSYGRRHARETSAATVRTQPGNDGVSTDDDGR